MAEEHEHWILELFAGLDADTVRGLHTQLGTLRAHLATCSHRPKETAPHEQRQRRHEHDEHRLTPVAGAGLDPALAAGNRKPARRLRARTTSAGR